MTQARVRVVRCTDIETATSELNGCSMVGPSASSEEIPVFDLWSNDKLSILSDKFVLDKNTIRVEKNHKTQTQH